MPIDELERHPFINYLDNNIDSEKKYTGLIIGSFPVYSCTDSLDQNLEVSEERFNKEEVKMRFFYGSRRSEFWEYCSRAFEQGNPTCLVDNFTTQRTIDFLNINNLLITDVICQTNRKNTSAADSDLWQTEAPLYVANNLSLNDSIIDIINGHPSIKNLFFTAKGTTRKTPFGWFKEICGETFPEDNWNNDSFGKNIEISGRQFNAFLLPTPKPRAIHFTDENRNPHFVHYLQSVDREFFNEIDRTLKDDRSDVQEERLKVLRKDFLIESYRQAFVENNLDFDGHINAT